MPPLRPRVTAGGFAAGRDEPFPLAPAVLVLIRLMSWFAAVLGIVVSLLVAI